MVAVRYLRQGNLESPSFYKGFNSAEGHIYFMSSIIDVVIWFCHVPDLPKSNLEYTTTRGKIRPENAFRREPSIQWARMLICPPFQAAPGNVAGKWSPRF
jgi:hypothetical protein